MTVTLYPFRYRDPLTSRWIRARYKATRADIASTHAEWEIIGPAEVRSGSGGAFSPYRVDPTAAAKWLREPALQINPHAERPPAVDAAESFLLALFLPRYVTFCARRAAAAH
jgi:hypothetical protein